MRGAIWAAVGALSLAGGPAFPQSSPEADRASGAPPVCVPGPDKLGVSRTVEIDATGGPKFGVENDGGDFLADKEVVLTFDDGPMRRHTLAVLAALEEQCTKATFFIVGRMAVADPEALKEVARLGHTIGTHTWSHRNLRSIGEAKAEREIELGLSATVKALGHPVAPFFRFPYLSESRSAVRHLQERGLAEFSIDVDSKDFRTRSASQVQRRVLDAIEKRGKGIILFHDIQASTARGLKGLLAELKTRGFKIVHLTAKQTATTLPDYDALAEEELARKMVATTQPLAARSLVWPMLNDADEPPARPRKKRSRSRRSGSTELSPPGGFGALSESPAVSEGASEIHRRTMRR